MLQKDFSSLVKETAASSALSEAGGDLMKNIDFEWPQNVPNQSLYKSDPKRRNPNARIFTRQPDIERAMDQVFEVSKLEVRRHFLSFFDISHTQCGPKNIKEIEKKSRN